MNEHEQDAETIKSLNKKIEEFKDFVADAVVDGYLDNFAGDQYEFLKACMETFLDLKKDMEE